MTKDLEQKANRIIEDMNVYMYQSSFHALLQLKQIMTNDSALLLISENIEDLKKKLKIDSKNKSSMDLESLYNKYYQLYKDATITDDPDIDYYLDTALAIKKVLDIIDSEDIGNGYK